MTTDKRVIALKTASDRKLKMLCNVISGLKSASEIKSLITDLFTYSELNTIVQRMEIAQMLTKGMRYEEIVAITGASTATISRVNKRLLYGSGGYARAIERMQK